MWYFHPSKMIENDCSLSSFRDKSQDHIKLQTPLILERIPLESFLFFPTCQVRVVRFYVSLLLSSSPLFSSPLSLRPSVFLVTNCGTCEFSVPRRTSTAIRRGQRSAPDLDRDPVSSVFRAGPQPRSCM